VLYCITCVDWLFKDEYLIVSGIIISMLKFVEKERNGRAWSETNFQSCACLASCTVLLMYLWDYNFCALLTIFAKLCHLLKTDMIIMLRFLLLYSVSLLWLYILIYTNNQYVPYMPFTIFMLCNLQFLLEYSFPHWMVCVVFLMCLGLCYSVKIMRCWIVELYFGMLRVCKQC